MRVLLRVGVVSLLAVAACRDPFDPQPTPRVTITGQGGGTVSACPHGYQGCQKPVKYLGPSGECEVFSCGHGKKGAYVIKVSRTDTESLRRLHLMTEDE